MSGQRRDMGRELGRFLRSRRERILPADVGLPARYRRRAPGLRRDEVAVLAGLSPTWYTYLEQGRDIHPSGQVLDSLARVLSLTEDERRYLHHLARGAVEEPRPLVGDVSAEELVRQLVSTAGTSPYPVYGLNLYADLIAWNSAATSYYADFGALPPARRNMLRWLLEAPEAQQVLPEWKQDVPDIIARWRAAIAAHHAEPRVHQMVAEFRGLNPDFGHWWDGHEVRELRARTRTFRHPRLGLITMRLIVVQSPEFTPCAVVFHAPAAG